MSPQQIHTPPKVISLWMLLIFILLVSGTLILLVFFLPYAYLKPVVDRLASDGEVESFTPTVFAALTTLKWVGLALVLLGGGIWKAGEKAQRRLARALQRLTYFLRELAMDLRALVRAIRPQTDERGAISLLVAFTLVGMFMRGMFLSRPMRYDEAYTFNIFASRPIWRVMSDYHLPNNHIFHSLLVHLAFRLLGNQPWVIRLPAFLAGVLLVPAGYLGARAFFNRRAAVLAASLIALSPTLIDYSTNARGYTLLSLFTLLLLALGGYAKHHRNRAAWVLMGLLGTIGFYTLPLMLYPFTAVMVWLLLSWWRGDVSPEARDSFLRYLVTMCLGMVLFTGILYTPVVLINGTGKVFGNNFVRPLAWGDWWKKLLKRLAETGEEWQKGVPEILWGLLLAGLAVGVGFQRKMSGERFPLPVVLILVSGVLVVIQRVAPFERMWLFALPVFLLWAAAGLVFLFDSSLGKLFKERANVLPGVGIVLMILFLSGIARHGLIYQRKVSQRYSYAEEVVHYLETQLDQQDVVVSTFPDDAPIRYYAELHNLLDGRAFDFQSRPFRRVIVIVNPGFGQTPLTVLEKTGFPSDTLEMDAATLILKFKHLQLYALSVTS